MSGGGPPGWVTEAFEVYGDAGALGFTTIAQEITRLCLAPIIGTGRDSMVDDWNLNRLKGATGSLAAAAAMVPPMTSSAARQVAERDTMIAVPLFEFYARLLRLHVQGGSAAASEVRELAQRLHEVILSRQGDESRAQKILDGVRNDLFGALERLRPWMNKPHSAQELAALAGSGSTPFRDVLAQSELLVK